MTHFHLPSIRLIAASTEQPGLKLKRECQALARRVRENRNEGKSVGIRRGANNLVLAARRLGAVRRLALKEKAAAYASAVREAPTPSSPGSSPILATQAPRAEHGTSSPNAGLPKSQADRRNNPMPGINIRSYAVVTGGSNGIGYELAKQLVQHDYDVLIASEDEEHLAAAAR